MIEFKLGNRRAFCRICGKELYAGDECFVAHSRSGHPIFNCLDCTHPGNVDSTARVPDIVSHYDNLGTILHVMLS